MTLRGERIVPFGSRPARTIVFLVLLAVAASCKSAPVSSPRSDWADVVLQATGVGTLNASAGSAVETRILAIQAAKVSAYRKLEEEILHLQMDDRGSVSALVEKKPPLAEKVREFVRGARIASTRVVSERQMEVDAELFLGENFKLALGLVEPKPVRPKEGRSGQRPNEDFFQ